MKKIIMTALMACAAFMTLGGCRATIEVNESYPFTISHMPYFSQVEEGRTTEVRMTLTEEQHFADAKYTLRYFPYQGQGHLRIGLKGEALHPNDRYEVPVGDFRLYYTPTSGKQHSLELVFESSSGHSETITLDFSSNTSTEGDSGTEVESDLSDSELIEKMGESTTGFLTDGKAYEGSNGNYWINGQDTGVAIKEGTTPNVRVNRDGKYTIDGQPTVVTQPVEPSTIEDIVDRDEVILPSDDQIVAGEVNVILVSKGAMTTYEGQEIESIGVRPQDGGCIYRVYDRNKRPAPNARVHHMPRIGKCDLRADKDGFVFVPRQLLPTEGMPKEGRCESVSIGGQSYVTASNTLVMNRVVLTMKLQSHKDNKFYFTLAQSSDGVSIESNSFDLSKSAPLGFISVVRTDLLASSRRIEWHPFFENKVYIENNMVVMELSNKHHTEPTLILDKAYRPFFLLPVLYNAPYGGVITARPEIRGFVKDSWLIGQKQSYDKFIKIPIPLDLIYNNA